MAAETLHPRYHVLRALGEGGMAQTLLVRDNVTFARRAAKRTRKAEFVPFLEHEYDILARLDHPNLPKVYDLHSLADGNRLFTMDHAGDTSLGDFLKADRQWTKDDVVSVLDQLTGALSCCHANGILHHDIKPENILFSEPDPLSMMKVIDFGLASMEDDPASGQKGTVQYTAPEILRNEKSGPPADLYSLGVVLYEVITGHNPFDDPNVVNIVVNHLEKEIVSIPSRMDWVGDDLKTVILKCLRKDPRLRYQNTSELVQDLESFGIRAKPMVRRVFLQRGTSTRRIDDALRIIIDAKKPFVAIHIEGNPGTGKSSVVRYFKRLAERTHLRVIDLPVQPSASLENVARVLRSLVAEHITPLPERFEPEVRWIQDGTSPIVTDRDTFFSSLVELAMLCTDHRPMAVFVDDVDRLNAAEQVFFFRWFRRLQSGSGIFLCSAGADAPGWSSESSEEIRLENFSETEAAEYLSAALRSQDLPTELHLSLIRWTHGNPFLMRASIERLVETGALAFRNDRWHFDNRVDTPLPVKITDFLLERVKTLDTAALQLFRAASVFPGAFDMDLLESVTTDRFTPSAFRTLVERGLVHAFADRWIIGSEYLRQHLEQLLSEVERRQFHSQAATVLESRSTKSDHDLAHHWFSSSHPEKAVPYLLRSARQDRDAFQPDSALEKLRKTLPLLKSSDHAVFMDVLFSAEEICDQLGDRKEQQTFLEMLSPLATDAATRIRWLLRQATLAERLGQLETARKYLEDAVDSGTRAGGERLGEAYRLLGRLCYLQHDYAAARLNYEKALQAAADDPDAELQIKARNSLATVFGSMGDQESARREFEEVELLSQALEKTEYRVQAVLNIAQTFSRQSRFDEALDRLRSVESDLKKTKNRKLELHHARYSGFAHLRLKRLEAADTWFSRAWEIAFEIDDKEAMHSMLYRRGTLLGRIGLIKSSESVLNQAVQLAISANHRADVTLYQAVLASILATQGRIDEALDRVGRIQDWPGTESTSELQVYLRTVHLDLLTQGRFKSMTLDEFERGVCPLDALVEQADTHSRSIGIFTRSVASASLRAMGRIGEAVQRVTEAASLLEQETSYEYDDAEVWYRCHEICAGAQRPREEVGRYLERAYQSVKSVENGLKRSDYRTSFLSRPLIGKIVSDYKHFFDEERESDIRSFQTLHAIVEDINSILDTDVLFNRIMDSAIEHTGADRGMILLYNEAIDTFEIKVARNMDQETLTDMTHISRSVVREVFDNGQSLITADANEDERFKTRQSIVAFQIRSVMCVPLRVKERRLGAVYVDKQFDTHHFTPRHTRFLESFANMAGIAIENAKLYENVRMEKESLSRENEDLKSEVREKYQKYNIVGKGKAIRKVFHLIDSAAEHSATVLIQGESGTGKELVAKAIHYNGSRRNKKFVAVDCGALPENLLESELFGYKKGAFTGAVADKVGLFEEADGGTIFLDEVSNTSTVLQAKLLRVLQENEIRRVGETSTRKIDVRVIAATNRQLIADIKAGLFREDLYYRINVVPIVLPPLRERREDIPVLVSFFMEKYAALHRKEKPSMAPELMNTLMALPWEGNIRELENVVNRMVIFCSGNRLGLEHLPDTYQKHPITDKFVPRSTTVPDPVRFHTLDSMEEFVNGVEKGFFEEILSACGGNKSEAAKKLGIKRTTLNDRLKKHGLL